MKNLIEKINVATAAFVADAEKCANGNKAAGVRARKVSREVEGLLKEFRKASVDANK